MDPTKNFDHLDPKLKDTYARVMGTTPAAPADAAQPAPAQPAANPAFAAPGAAQPQNQFSTPMDQPITPAQNPYTGPNPGTGPSVGAIPTETTQMIAQPAQPAPAANNAPPANNSFFSNPSPATTDPAQNPVQAGAENNLSAPFAQAADPAAQAPVTPYSGDNQPQYADASGQPLPSPSSVAQNATKEASPLLRVLYIIGAVVFFAIYTVFWIKVFNLPFLF